MRIAVTGARGFIGSNLLCRLREVGSAEVVAVAHDLDEPTLGAAVAECGFVFHLAGVNRPQDPAEFQSGNVDYTERLLAALSRLPTPPAVAFASSVQATRDNEYGRSKRAAEERVLEYGRSSGADVHVFRLTNVFGKWCRPSYNSVVATFCHNLARGLPIAIDDAAAPLRLVYVDDVVDAFLRLLDDPRSGTDVTPAYDTTVGEIADLLRSFAERRTGSMAPRAGRGLRRALYATFVSYLPTEAFAYRVPVHDDARGAFAEMLKTPEHGQFSYFTAKPGVTRGGHYHHSKTEKFLVVQGTARFGFRHVRSGQKHELVVRGGEGAVVETVPGWAHDVANVGDDELVVMLWANEVFDPSNPDTVAAKVRP